MTASLPGAIEQQVCEIEEDFKVFAAALKRGERAEAYIDVHEGASEQLAEVLEGVTDPAIREEAQRRFSEAWQQCRTAIEGTN